MNTTKDSTAKRTPGSLHPVVMPHWFDAFKASVQECVGKPRTGERWTVNPRTHTTKIHHVIEVQLHTGGGFHPVLLPTGAWYFDTAEERDKIYEALVRHNND